jgi:membrane-associated protein
VLDFLSQWVSQSPLTYLVILALALADILALVPADTVLVTAVVLALQGPLLVAGVGVAAFVGAVAGDNILYVLGRTVGSPLIGRLFRSESSRERLDWAHRQMHRHYNLAIIAGRFVPVGRTATMFAAGLSHLPWRRFIVPETIAAALWVAYYVGMSVLFGDAVPGWVTIVVALGIAAVLAGIADLVRRFVEHRMPHRTTADGASR